jgi:hypothetical protein
MYPPFITNGLVDEVNSMNKNGFKESATNFKSFPSESIE